MKQNIMKKWVRTLRSDKYKQGQGFLKQTTTNDKTYHCCLGVLCELYDNEMRKSKKKTLSEQEYNGIHKFNKQPECLPKTVQKWAGLFSKMGDFRNVDRSDISSYGNFTSLTEMNDIGCSFKQIAKTIEREWENL